MMPDVAQRAGVRLERANSIGQTLSQSSILLAPALAGILIGVIGSAPVLFVTMGLLIISTMAVLLFVPANVSRAHVSVDPQRQYVAELKRGLSFLLSTKLVLALMIASIMIQFGRANMMVVMPVYAHDHLESAADFGFMFAALGGGGLVSSILYGIWGHRWPRRPVVLVGLSSMLVGFALLALTPPYWFILSGLSVAGFLAGPMVPLVRSATVAAPASPSSRSR
jgi:predicted MFS family arabinose efflux permease